MRAIAPIGLAALLAASVAAAEDKAVPPANGSPEAAAQIAFREGVELFKNARYEEAVAAFRRANEIRPSWKILYNIGQCEAALKRYGRALEAFETYLAEGGDDVPTERVDYVIEEVRRLKEMVGSIDFGVPAGLSVVVDGEVRGRTPLGGPVRVTAGVPHAVRLLADFEEVSARTVTVGSGQQVTIELGEGKAAQPISPHAAEPAASLEPQPAPEGRTRLAPVYFWVGLGVTGALGIGTVALELAIKDKWEEASADPANASLKDEGKSLQAAGIALLACTGAAALATAVLAIFTDFRGDEDDAPVSIGPASVQGGGGLAVEGRF